MHALGSDMGPTFTELGAYRSSIDALGSVVCPTLRESGSDKGPVDAVGSDVCSGGSDVELILAALGLDVASIYA